jgi:CRISPR-associated protein Csm1
MEIDEREYNSVVLAALLHDVGKFLHRITGIEEFKGTHARLGADFVTGKNEFSENGKHKELNFFSKQIRDEWVYKDRLEESIRKHHSGKGTWGWIVHKADSYSTKERFKEDEGVTTYPPKGRIIPLKAIFPSIDLGKVKPSERFGYDATLLDSFKTFPIEKKKELMEGETGELFAGFIAELRQIELKDPTFDKYFSTLHSIFEKYFWSLPCHTHPDISDVSIFDHLKTSSAIAACLYQYHSFNNVLEVKYIKKDDEKKFLLVGGDLSGIQKYIYQISSITGEGGVAKRLRARSFYVSALVEVIITKILRELNLPVSCNLISAGGKFVILVPNLDDLKYNISTIYKEISDWLLEEFSGELSLIMDWSTAIQGDDFYKKTGKESLDEEENEEEGEAEDPRKCNFRDRIDEMYNAVENSKVRKFETSLLESTGWKEINFIRTAQYAPYGEGASDCRSCNKFPAEYADPHDSPNGEIVLCRKCTIDKVIGRKLLDAIYLAIGCDESGERKKNLDKTKPLTWDYFFFLNDNYFIQPLKNYRWDNDYLVVQRLRDHGVDKEPLKLGTVHRFLANYTPAFEACSDGNSLCLVCKEARPCEQVEMMKIKRDDKNLYTFSCIAAASSEQLENDEAYRGSQLIGVLKADVDNLGLIFSEGLGNMLTVSRYLTMSRMIDLFFSGWMYRILKEDDNFKEIYTVYSGGDDLVLVGPWEKTILFAKRFNDEFRRFTCNNDNITLSAGLAVVQPKFPISAAIELADQNLEASKLSGKDSITLFDTTVKWSALGGLINFKDILNKGHHDFDDILTTRFIHKLLTYHKMYLDFKKGDVTKLIFHSRMNFDVRRNLEERLEKKEDGESKNWFKDNVLKETLRLYQAPTDDLLMQNLKIPVFWTLYKNREYKKGGTI